MKDLRTLLLVFTLLLLGSTTAYASLSDFFVGTDWLSENRQDVVVVDVRVAPLYLLGHIDGALHIDQT